MFKRLRPIPKNPLRLFSVLSGLAAIFLLGGLASAHPLPGAGNCPIFPSNNVWNTPVDHSSVAADSSAVIAAMGLDKPLHAAFGSGLWDGTRTGIPVTVVSGRHVPHVRVRFDPEYAPRAFRGRYPLPRWAPVEDSSSDHHVIVVDKDSCRDYELFGAQHRGNSWSAVTGVVFNLRSNASMPIGWTSADAAGLPILPGLARYGDVARGSIDHALRFTVPATRAAFIYPARHYGSRSSGRFLPPMGLRVRLKASVNISHLPRQARIIAIALKRYGMILADNGPAWFISGAPSSGWNNLALKTVGRLTGRDFEVVN
jgi:hypothetical protein